MRAECEGATPAHNVWATLTAWVIVRIGDPALKVACDCCRATGERSFVVPADVHDSGTTQELCRWCLEDFRTRVRVRRARLAALRCGTGKGAAPGWMARAPRWVGDPPGTVVAPATRTSAYSPTAYHHWRRRLTFLNRGARFGLGAWMVGSRVVM